MKAIISLLLSLALLCGCSPALNAAALPDALVERMHTQSVSELAVENIVLKLFDYESDAAVTLHLRAQADKTAQRLLGADLAGVRDLLPLLCLTMRAQQDGLLPEGEQTDAAKKAQAFSSVLPHICALFPKELSCVKDGRTFLRRKVLTDWAAGFGLDAETVAASWAYDESNDGWLFETSPAQDLDLTVLTALKGEDENRVQLDLLSEQAAETRRALVTLEKSGEHFRLTGITALEAQTSPFCYADSSLGLTEQTDVAELSLSLLTGEGIRMEQSADGLCLRPVLSGTVSVGEAGEPSRAALYISKLSHDGRPRAEDSAYASAAAAQTGYALKGLQVVDLHVSGCVFLGSNDAYVLRYTVVSATDAPLQSIEHYVVEAPNDELYHFVYRYDLGYADAERESLLKASQTIRFKD